MTCSIPTFDNGTVRSCWAGRPIAPFLGLALLLVHSFRQNFGPWTIERQPGGPI